MIKSDNPLPIIFSIAELRPTLETTMTNLHLTKDMLTNSRFTLLIGFYVTFFENLSVDVVVDKNGFMAYLNTTITHPIFRKEINEKEDLILVNVTNNEPNILMQYLYCFNAILDLIKKPF